MEEDFGGPVWHASGRGKTTSDSKRIALAGLRGVGDAQLGEWTEEGASGIVHVVRRMTAAEREEFAVPEPFDIRGTPEETRRIAQVYAEAPYLLGRL